MEIEEKIIKLLTDNPEGYMIQEISDKLKVHRQTVTVALAKLEGQARVEIREFGNAKVYKIKEASK